MKMKNETQINYYKCTKCGAMFKKECPSDRICTSVDKCVKCGSNMIKVGNPYNGSKSVA